MGKNEMKKIIKVLQSPSAYAARTAEILTSMTPPQIGGAKLLPPHEALCVESNKLSDPMNQVD